MVGPWTRSRKVQPTGLPDTPEVGWEEREARMALGFLLGLLEGWDCYLLTGKAGQGEHKGGSLELERTRCARGNVDREPVVQDTDRI